MEGQKEKIMESNTKVINRLKRAEGQISGIIKMIEEERECVDIVTQMSAVRSSIDSVMGIVVAENLYACVKDPNEDEKVQQEKLNKAIKMIIKK